MPGSSSRAGAAVLLALGLLLPAFVPTAPALVANGPPAPLAADAAPTWPTVPVTPEDALALVARGLGDLAPPDLALRHARGLPAAWPAPSLDPSADAPLVEGPELAISGNFTVSQPMFVKSITFTNATVRFAHGAYIAALNPNAGKVTAIDSAFIGVDPSKNALHGDAGVEVRRSTFQGVTVYVRPGTSSNQGAAVVEGSAFRDGPVGVILQRTGAEVHHNTFANLTKGLQGRFGGGTNPAAGYRVHNNTFEMNLAGISAEETSVGTFEHNLLRGNFFGISCTGTGWSDAQGVHHRAVFRANNAFTNIAEGVAGYRGVTVATPIGPVAFPSSACAHQDTYLGPAGAARDSYFLSTDDTFDGVAEAPHATSAPALPLPLTEVTTATTWTGARSLDGPVVVNSPGSLNVNNATLGGAALLGAKLGGRITVDNTTVDPRITLALRNAADILKASVVGGLSAPRPLWMYRCNCTVRDSAVTAGGVYASAAVSVFSGQLTDDTAWLPRVERNHLHAPAGYGVDAQAARVVMQGNTIVRTNTGVNNFLGTVTLDGNAFTGNSFGAFGFLGTTVATGNRFESGLAGILSGLNTDSSTSDVYAAMQVGLIAIISPSASVTLGNFSHNGMGIFTTLSVVNVASSNFHDNLPLSLVAIPLELEGLNIPTSIKCATCWAPADEAWFGNVTYTPAVVPNQVPQPSYAGRERVAGNGQTLDVTATPEGPVVARSGGTVRIRDAAVTLDPRYPLGTKGGGMTNLTTGRVEVENATLAFPPIDVAGPGSKWAFLPLNSTNSRVTQAVFQGFPQAAVRLFWNGGGSFACSAFEATPWSTAAAYGFLYAPGPGGSALEGTRLLFRGGGVQTGLGYAQEELRHNATVTLRDSALAPEGTGELLVVTGTSGADARLHGNNLLGSGGRLVVANAIAASPVNATDNWWTFAGGPGGAVRTQGAVRASPWLTAPAAPAPCTAFDVLTAQPREDGPTAFRARVIDPSALGIAAYTWDFGDGQPPVQSTGPEVEHRFPDGGTYQVTLTATSNSTGSASITRTVTVAHTPPTAGFGEDVADEVTAVQFHDLSTHGNPNDAPPAGWTYAWTFGDSSTGADREPAHRYADGGTYNVQLQVTDNDGRQHSTGHSVAVPHVAPVASFAVQGILETDTFQLSDTSTHPNAPTDGIVNRTWQCSDGFTAFASAAVQHRFADGGTITCTLAVRDDDGLGSTATRTFDVQHVAPAAAFALPAGTEVATLGFTDQSTHPNAPRDAVVAWAWAFGDGATSDQRDPAHRYADGGTYEVALAVTDDDGLGASLTRTLQVPHVAPAAAFAFSPTNPDPGEDVAFADLSTHPNAPVDGIVAWAWDFGDGNTSTLPDPVHAYAERDQYEVRLTVTDDDGLTASVVLRVPVGNLPPVAAFAHSPDQPTDLDTVQFTDQSSDADGTIVAWAWAFGDGATSALPSPSHAFDDDGTYLVSLTVTDDLGAVTTLAVPLVVRNVAPTAAFDYAPDHPVVGEPVGFGDFSTDPDGQVVAWQWDFGDGTGSTQQGPGHTYAEGGDYVVTLTVTDDDGAQHSTSQTVHVCETGVALDPATLSFHVEVCPRIGL